MTWSIPRTLLIVGFTAPLLFGVIGVLTAVILAPSFTREPAIERGGFALERI